MLGLQFLSRGMGGGVGKVCEDKRAVTAGAEKMSASTRETERTEDKDTIAATETTRSSHRIRRQRDA
jgi:hypothetical protein